MATTETIPVISFNNQLSYAINIYDSYSDQDPKNYLGKLTLLGTVAANTTADIQPLHTTSVFIVSNASTESPLARCIKMSFDDTDSFSITSADEAAMTATFQFIDLITQHPEDQTATAFKAIWTGTQDDIVSTVNNFFSQHSPYTKCTFQTYMMGLSFAAQTPAKTVQPLSQATCSLSRLVALLGGTWPAAFPDITVSHFTCNIKDSTLDLWAEIDVQQLPAESDQVLKNFSALLPGNKFMVNLQFHYGFDLGIFGTRLSFIFENIDIPTGKGTTLTIQKPTVIIDINPLFKFVVFTIKGSIPFSVFKKQFNADISMTIDNVEAAIGAVIRGDNSSLPSPPVMKGVHFDEFGVGIGIFFEPPGYVIGIQGKFHIGEPNGHYTVQLDDDTFVVVCQIEEELPNPIYTSFYVPKMDLNEVLEIFTDTQTQTDLPLSFSNLSFKWAENPMEPVVLPDGSLSSMAMGFSADVNLLSFGFYGDVSVDVNNGLTALVESSPLSFKDVFRLSGDGKGVTIKVDENGNPIKNNQLRTTQAMQQALKNAKNKQLVSPGGPVLSIRTFPFPALHINGKVSLFELADYGIDANVGKDGIRFTLDFGGILTRQMSCTLTDQFWGEFKYGISRRINLPGIAGVSLGSIPLQALADAHIRINATGSDVIMRVGGSLYFEGLNRSFGDFVADISIKRLSDVLASIGDYIEKNALQIFGDLVSVAEAWTRNVRRGIISIVNPVGDVLKHAFGKGAADVARIMKNAGFPAGEVASALKNSFSLGANQVAGFMKQAGYTAGEVVNALKNIFSLKEISAMLKDVFGLRIHNINDILQQAGFSPHMIEDAFKSLGGDFGHFAKKVWDKLNPSHW